LEGEYTKWWVGEGEFLVEEEVEGEYSKWWVVEIVPCQVQGGGQQRHRPYHQGNSNHYFYKPGRKACYLG
jgi:hypothetical protein